MDLSNKETRKVESGTKYRKRALHWSGKVPVCIIYPNTYFLAMSNLGFQTIYHLFSSDGRFAVDRLFYSNFNKSYIPLSHETGHRLNEFYILAFSISYENDILNLLKILKKGEIPLKRGARGDKFPLLISGGAAVTLNPGALSQVLDAFFIGECEDAFSELADRIVTAYERKYTKEHLIRSFSEIDGFYIPGLYNFEFNRDGRITEISPFNDAPRRVRRRITSNINEFVPRTFLFTSDTEFKNMGVIEISRGCRWKCRFCAASYIYNPVRFRSGDVIKEELLKMSGYCSKFGLFGPLPTDHPELKYITDFLLHINKRFSLSSVRVGSLDNEILLNLKAGGERTITIAPETGNERLRKVIDKRITNQAIFSQIDRVVKNGINRVKLYFLIGLPTEKDEDVYSISELTGEITKVFRKIFLTLSVGIFIPKPHTPFQWAGITRPDIIERRIKILKKELRNSKHISLEVTSFKTAKVEAMLSHGDAGLSDKLIEWVNSGNLISKLLKVTDYNDNVFRNKGEDEIFHWDIIDNGINRSFLLSEYKYALSSHELSIKV